jgi:hypothetical protein
MMDWRGDSRSIPGICGVTFENISGRKLPGIGLLESHDRDLRSWLEIVGKEGCILLKTTPALFDF